MYTQILACDMIRVIHGSCMGIYKDWVTFVCDMTRLRMAEASLISKAINDGVVI